MKKAGNQSPKEEESEESDGGVVFVDKLDFYFLDSSNMKHLDIPDKDCPEFFNKRVKDRVDVGMKPTNKFAVKMAIQSIFDVRRSLTILQDIFSNHTPLQHYYA